MPGLGQGHNQKKDTHTLDFDVTLSLGLKQLTSLIFSFGKICLGFRFGQQPVNYLLNNSVNHFVNSKDVLTGAQKRVYPCHHDVAGAFELAVTRVS